MSKQSEKQETIRNEPEKRETSEDERSSNRFSFIVGIFIAMAIIVVFVLLFNH
ncbi:MAG TPA: hypothetical protein VGU68_18865 [Ktedonobacteraceae bacterium]|nr:hypothetical protein [Ktedonobacteraceae bacterium]